MLESPLPFFISQKPGEILIFGTFLAKLSIFAYILLKIGYFELGDDSDVMRRHGWDVCTYFGMFGKKRP